MQTPLIISNTTDLIRIMPSDIMCIIADGNYSTIHVVDGDRQVVLYQLGQIEHSMQSQLGDESLLFIRVGRGAIININYIYTISLTKQQLTLRSFLGVKVDVEASRNALKQLKSAIDGHIATQKLIDNMEVKEIFTTETEFGFDKIDDKSRNIIKVIGVGGGGGNAVRTMEEQGVANVSFAVINTDSQALANSNIQCRIGIGKTGLGVGGRPELGREAAEFSVEDIRHLLSDGTRMVFITAGMGGGTGTGAAPVIARVAREMDILTVGVVTLPFQFEKRLRIEKALEGVQELRKNVDALLVINNERLLEIYADGITTVEDAFRKADDVLTIATKSIAEIITIEGKINCDFCDVQTVMKDSGGAIVSVGRASGEGRILKAMAEALTSPLFNKVDVCNAQRILYVIYQSHKNQVKISEIAEINKFMEKMANDLEVIWGIYWDDTLEDEVKVSIIATGFDKERPVTNKEEDNSLIVSTMMEQYYGATSDTNPITDTTVKEPTGKTLSTVQATDGNSRDEEQNDDDIEQYDDDQSEDTPDAVEEVEKREESFGGRLLSVLKEKIKQLTEEDDEDEDESNGTPNRNRAAR